ncbi:F-actin-capping protein subunit alpha [Tyrophagus putrescentiae]|nr:F-actin-capping protein subunit alpha [Tyrophagus putrescentiae]
MASMMEFDDLLAASLVPFIALSAQIGGPVQEQATLLAEAFRQQRSFIEMAGKSAKPATDGELLQLLQPLNSLASAIHELKEKNRKHELFNHLSALSESANVLAWLAVAPTPAPFAKEILVAYKEKPELAHHVTWARTLIVFLQSLQQYIRKHHTTGLVWASVATIPGGVGGAPPPPPPPCNLNLGPSAHGGGDKAMDDARAALFADINRGTDITKGLRKVNADQMTHKNAALRTSSTVPGGNAPSSGGPGGKSRGPEKFELDGKKWIIENLSGRRDLEIPQAEMGQTVTVFRCDNCVLSVKGKVHSINVIECKKFSLVFEAIMGTVEFTRCQNIQAQALSTVPTISIDVVDAVELYLSQQALEQASIVSSKSSAVNISVPNAKGDYVEHPIPEQFLTKWDGKGFKTEPISKS